LAPSQEASNGLVNSRAAGDPGGCVEPELVILGTPYVVAYRVHANDVEVLTIQHGAQMWSDRLEFRTMAHTA
jgi:hypothetical protein